MRAFVMGTRCDFCRWIFEPLKRCVAFNTMRQPYCGNAVFSPPAGASLSPPQPCSPGTCARRAFSSAHRSHRWCHQHSTASARVRTNPGSKEPKAEAQKKARGRRDMLTEGVKRIPCNTFMSLHNTKKLCLRPIDICVHPQAAWLAFG